MTRVGIFIDADNLFPFWLSSAAAPNRSEPITHYIQRDDFTAMLDEVDGLAGSEGSVVFREAYGSWANSARQIPASLMYHHYGYDLQHVPALSRERQAGKPARISATQGDSNPSSLKNAGDILLSIRATLAATRAHSLDTIVVGAADKDYHQLVAELKRLGKRVVCLAFRQKGQQAQLLLDTFDAVLELTTVKRWDELDRDQEAGQRRPPPTPAKLAVEIRPPEPVRALVPKDPYVLTKRLWNAASDPGTSSESLATVCVIDYSMEPAVVDRFLANTMADACFALEAGLTVTVEQDYDVWKNRVILCLVDALVAEYELSSSPAAMGPAAWADGARSFVVAQFGPGNHRIPGLVEEALGRRAVGITDNAPAHGA